MVFCCSIFVDPTIFDNCCEKSWRNPRFLVMPSDLFSKMMPVSGSFFNALSKLISSWWLMGYLAMFLCVRIRSISELMLWIVALIQQSSYEREKCWREIPPIPNHRDSNHQAFGEMMDCGDGKIRHFLKSDEGMKYFLWEGSDGIISFQII